MSFTLNKFKISSGILHTSIKILEYFKELIISDDIQKINKLFISDLSYSIIFLEQCGYIKKLNNKQYIILKSFDSSEYKLKIKELLKEYIINYNPLWTNRIKWGLSSMTKDLTINELHCFNEVALLDFNKIENIFWWNELPYFEDQNINKRKIGAIGEYLTILYETNKTKSKPIQTSLIGSFHGYDVLSINNNILDTKKFIECKTTIMKDNYIINITINEWETAISNKDIYFFHIWKLDIKTKISVLYEISVEEMVEHIPKPSDSNYGNFTNASINLTTLLKDKKSSIEYNNLLIFEDLTLV